MYAHIHNVAKVEVESRDYGSFTCIKLKITTNDPYVEEWNAEEEINLFIRNKDDLPGVLKALAEPTFAKDYD